MINLGAEFLFDGSFKINKHAITSLKIFAGVVWHRMSVRPGITVFLKKKKKAPYFVQLSCLEWPRCLVRGPVRYFPDCVGSVHGDSPR